MLRLYVEIFLSSNIFENDKVIVPAPTALGLADSIGNSLTVR